MWPPPPFYGWQALLLPAPRDTASAATGRGPWPRGMRSRCGPLSLSDKSFKTVRPFYHSGGPIPSSWIYRVCRGHTQIISLAASFSDHWPRPPVENITPLTSSPEVTSLSGCCRVDSPGLVGWLAVIPADRMLAVVVGRACSRQHLRRRTWARFAGRLPPCSALVALDGPPDGVLLTAGWGDHRGTAAAGNAGGGGSPRFPLVLTADRRTPLSPTFALRSHQ